MACTVYVWFYENGVNENFTLFTATQSKHLHVVGNEQKIKRNVSQFFMYSGIVFFALFHSFPHHLDYTCNFRPLRIIQ